MGEQVTGKEITVTLRENGMGDGRQMEVEIENGGEVPSNLNAGISIGIHGSYSFLYHDSYSFLLFQHWMCKQFQQYSLEA